MAIRPIDVRRKEFKNGFRGYDANQVDDFLDQVADEFERAYTDNQRMREEVSSLRERLQQFEDLEGSIRSALVHAEQASNDLRNSAQREADEVRLGSQRDAESLRINSQKEAEITIQDAQTRSHQMLADSSGRVERIQESYESLMEAKREFKNDFRQLLRTYMDVMEDMEVTTAKGIESSLRNRLDTESMAVAREAAASDSETDDSATGDISSTGRETSGATSQTDAAFSTQSTGGGDPEEPQNNGPLYDEGSESGSPSQTTSSSDETRRIDLSEMQGGYQPPEFSDTDLDPDSSRLVENRDDDEMGDYDSGDGPTRSSETTDDEVRGNDEMEVRKDPAADEFFDREDRSGREEKTPEDNRIFRASRFLRRRG